MTEDQLDRQITQALTAHAVEPQPDPGLADRARREGVRVRRLRNVGVAAGVIAGAVGLTTVAALNLSRPVTAVVAPVAPTATPSPTGSSPANDLPVAIAEGDRIEASDGAVRLWVGGHVVSLPRWAPQSRVLGDGILVYIEDKFAGTPNERESGELVWFSPTTGDRQQAGVWRTAVASGGVSTGVASPDRASVAIAMTSTSGRFELIRFDTATGKTSLLLRPRRAEGLVAWTAQGIVLQTQESLLLAPWTKLDSRVRIPGQRLWALPGDSGGSVLVTDAKGCLQARTDVTKPEGPTLGCLANPSRDDWNVVAVGPGEALVQDIDRVSTASPPPFLPATNFRYLASQGSMTPLDTPVMLRNLELQAYGGHQVGAFVDTWSPYKYHRSDDDPAPWVGTVRWDLETGTAVQVPHHNTGVSYPER